MVQLNKWYKWMACKNPRIKKIIKKIKKWGW